MPDKTIRLRKGRKGRLRPHHPWIFKAAIPKAAVGIKPGDIVAVESSEGEFIGRGYYNPSSEISIRLLTFGDESIDSSFLGRKIKEAIDKRGYLKEITDARRLIFSEADSLPGLIVDQYADTLVVQVFTLGMEKLKPEILKILAGTASPEYIYEKSDSPFRKIENLKPEKKWLLYEGNPRVQIYEGRAKFIVDIENGHKTGFYLDQRKARSTILQISKGKKVLDLFCYTGGFSINAALGGAVKVKGIDIKERWLSLARENAALNGVSDRCEFESGDVFEALKNICNSQEKFDIIILDPPSFAKDRYSVITAAKGYKELNTLAMKALIDGGILCTFSCSHNMTNDIFSKVIKDSAKAAVKSYSIMKRCHQDKDHPISRSIPETEYLKGYFLQLRDDPMHKRRIG